MRRETRRVWCRLAQVWNASALLRRWIAFYAVAALGMVVQLSTLGALTGWLGLHYLLGTGLAVEAAVLHNFIWHESWTWAERVRGDKAGRWGRLARFNLTTGALSIGGNLIFTKLFVDHLAMNYALANLGSIAVCSILNFFACDRLVFRRSTKECGRVSGAPLVTHNDFVKVRPFSEGEEVCETKCSVG